MIDRVRFADIASRHADAPFAKYLDLDVWLERNRRRIEFVCLDKRPRRRVLDLGCGCGYFVHLCRELGHDAIGIDLPDDPMYREITELLGVPVTYAAVEPFRPLPVKGPFDVLTAHMVTFNGHCSDKVWGPVEWRFLLEDIGAPTVSIELNREYDGTLWTPGLREFFESRGAQIDAHRVLIDRRG